MSDVLYTFDSNRWHNLGKFGGKIKLTQGHLHWCNYHKSSTCWQKGRGKWCRPGSDAVWSAYSHFAYHPEFKTGVWCPLLRAILRPRCKIWVKTAENEKSWSDKPLAVPIATSEIVLLYALSNLTKRSDKSINHFNDSGIFIFLANVLFTIRFALIILHFKYRITIFTRQCGLLWYDQLLMTVKRKRRKLGRSKWRTALFICRICRTRFL